MTDETLRHASAHVFVDDLSNPILSHDDAHHLARVLRLRNGENVTCSDGRGRWRECEWRSGGLVAVGEIVTVASPSPRLCVAVSPVKGDRIDDAVQRLVEIGVDHVIVLSPLERSVVRRDTDRSASHMERLARVVRAAAMQSRRVFLPTLEGPVAFDEVLGRDGVAIAEPGGETPWSEVTTVVVGPEGGFSPGEIDRATRRVSLGGSILRAETAVMVAGARLVGHWRP